MKPQLSFAQRLCLVCLAITGLCSILSLNATAQVVPRPPCWQHHASIVFPFPRLQSHLPLETGMPYDVMLAYVFYDSLARRIKEPSVAALYDNLSYSDTLRYAMKYCYKMVDYNPVLFERFRRYNDTHRRYALDRSEVFYKLYKKVEKTSPNPFMETLICQSSIIAHILVTDTVSLIDTSNSTHFVTPAVTAIVLDTLKGRVLPPCINFYPAEKRQENTPLPLMTSNSCLQFSYMLDWQRIPFGSNIVYSGETMMDENGVPWVQKDKEYIVFLNFGAACSDSLYTYHDLGIFGIRSSSNNIYRIANGKVLDPENDFGLGTTPTVADFKNALRQKIHSITHFGE